MADPTAALVLTKSPSLAPLLARGALLSPFKRPGPDGDFPRTRLVLPGLRVDLARLAAYERVCGFPTGEDALPVTYPHVLGFPLAMRLMSGRDFPLPLLGLVHTSIEITRHARMTATGAYELSVHVEGLAPHRRGTEAMVVTEVRGDGDLVWESRSTYLARHRTQGPVVGLPGRRSRASRCPRPPVAARRGRRAAVRGRLRGPQPHPPAPAHGPPVRLPPGHRARHVDGRPLPRRARHPGGLPICGRSSGRRCCCPGGDVRGAGRPVRAARRGGTGSM